MNAIKLQYIAEGYLDVTRNGRFQRIEYDNAFNSAIKNFIDSITGTTDTPFSHYQLNQVYQDNLYTLQKVQSAAPTADIALYPTDYRSLDKIFATIGGVTVYCRPMTQNKLGPVLIDSYRVPTDVMPYYIQDTTGFRILHGSGTITNVDMNYIKAPIAFSIGKDAQLIDAGAGVLTLGVSYVATNPATQNGVFYNIGDQFTAAVTTTLASGQVIPFLSTTTTDLPEKVQEEIAKMAAEIMLGSVKDFDKSAFAEKQANQS